MNIFNYIYTIVTDCKDTISSFFEEEMKGRMTKYIERYNSKECHPYKPFIVSLKSKQVLSYFNKLDNLEDKLKFISLFDDIMVNVSKKIYNKYDPHMIYSFHDEIHLVFYWNDNGNYMYSGNINKIITALTSFISIELTKEFNKRMNDLDFIYTAQLVEFDQDYEVLNYLVWRQLDCKRNTITLLYKCANLDSYLTGVEFFNLKLNAMEKNVSWFVKNDLNKYCTGNILKKSIYYKQAVLPQIRFENKIISSKNKSEDSNFVMRKRIELENIYFSDNFKENLNKYIKNKIM